VIVMRQRNTIIFILAILLAMGIVFAAAPTVTVVNPTPVTGANISVNFAFINFTSVRSGTPSVSGCVLQWNGVNQTPTKNNTLPAHSVDCYVNKTSLTDGTYSYKEFSNDTSNATTVVAMRNVTIDTTAPVLAINAPTLGAGTNVSANFYFVNVTSTDALLSTTGCVLESNGVNYTLSTNVTLPATGNVMCYLNKTSQSDGTYTYKVWTNDTLNNTAATAFRNVTIDTAAPTITYQAPTPVNTTITQAFAYFNVTSVNALTPVSGCVLQLTNSTSSANTTMAIVGSGTSVTCYANMTGLGYDSYTAKVFSNDTVNNTGVVATGFTIAVLIFDESGTYVTYNDVITADPTKTLANITILVNVTAYNNSGSVSNNNANPLLSMEIYNGTNWLNTGNITPTGTGNYTTSTTEPTILAAWNTTANADIRIRGMLLDKNGTNTDQINYTDIVVSTESTSADGSCGILDFASRQLNATRLAADTFLVLDSVGRQLVASRQVGEAFLFADASGRTYTGTQIASDLFTYKDSSGRVLTATRTASDSFVVIDSMGRTLVANRLPSDSVVLFDSNGRTYVGHLLAGDLVVFADGSGRNLTAQRISIEQLNSSDTTQRTLFATRSVEDDFLFSDLVAIEHILGSGVVFVSAGDQINLYDSTGRQITVSRLSDDLYTISDSLARIFTATRSNADAFAVTDSSGRQLIAYQNPGENLVFVDGAGQQLNATRVTDDFFTFVDAAGHTLTATRQNSEAFVVTDSIGRTLFARQVVGDQFVFVDSSGRQFTGTRTSSDQFVFSDSNQTQLTAFRQSNDTLYIADAAGRTYTATLISSDTITFVDALGEVRTIQRTAGDIVTVYDSSGRQLATLQLGSDQMVFTDSAGRIFTSVRQASDVAVTVDTGASQRGVFQSIADSLSFQAIAQTTNNLVRLGYDVLVFVTKFLGIHISGIDEVPVGQVPTPSSGGGGGSFYYPPVKTFQLDRAMFVVTSHPGQSYTVNLMSISDSQQHIDIQASPELEGIVVANPATVDLGANNATPISLYFDGREGFTYKGRIVFRSSLGQTSQLIFMAGPPGGELFQGNIPQNNVDTFVQLVQQGEPWSAARFVITGALLQSVIAGPSGPESDVPKAILFFIILAVGLVAMTKKNVPVKYRVAFIPILVFVFFLLPPMLPEFTPATPYVYNASGPINNLTAGMLP
jgi:hypothetical protein